MTALAASLALAVALGAAPTPVPTAGYGPWRLGMTRESVAAQSDFGPYKAVPSTGGLETSQGRFEGKAVTVSFVFSEESLKKIQVWAYEGTDQRLALDAWIAVYRYLQRQFGAVEARSLQLPANPDDAALTAAITAALAAVDSKEQAKIQIAPVAKPQSMSAFSSLFRHPQHGYFVFLYFQER